MARILVVDDEPDICDLIALNLRLDSHHVDIAPDGERALAALASSRPDVLILDVMMPGRDGFGVLEAVKSDTTGLADLPVILLTARSDRLDRIRGGIEGAVVYLTKPFSVAALRQQVHLVLSGDPEPAQRLRAQRAALADLARVEAGSVGASTAPRPRLTRLEPHGFVTRAAPPPPPLALTALTARQRQVAVAVASCDSLEAAASALGVSRTHVYATLRRMADRLGVGSGPELATMLRVTGALDA